MRGEREGEEKKKVLTRKRIGPRGHRGDETRIVAASLKFPRSANFPSLPPQPQFRSNLKEVSESEAYTLLCRILTIAGVDIRTDGRSKGNGQMVGDR